MDQPKLLSLAEMSSATGRMLLRGSSRDWDSAISPNLQDLTESLFFSPGDGRIWLHEQRVLLLHASSFGSLRRDLIDTLGTEQARGYLTRAGYVSGARDAQLVRERWPDADAPSIFAAGTRLHALEGVVQVEPVRFDFDIEQGYYDGEFLWHHSIEDDQHIATYGIGTEAACWMELGYAIGYVSGLFGRLVIFREVECRSMGHTACRVMGKTAEQWGDVEEDVYYLNQSPFANSGGFGTPAPNLLAELPAIAEAAPDDNKALIGASSAFNSACQALGRVAPTRASVLLTGESGVGKEMFATMLHKISPRQAAPFIALNCAAIPDTLIESELFGVERGAFTGASESRPGRFERADRGTLFLDEIGSLSLTAQSKLLRVLQESEVERVGGVRVIKVDVRLVAASNVDLREAVQAGRFREDLFFRLNVFPIRLPPLRERRDDIPLLAHFFLKRYCREHGRHITGLTMRAMKSLLTYHFPGNIRELQNLIERGVISADEDGAIDTRHLFHSELPGHEPLYSITETGILARTSSTDADEFGTAAPSRKSSAETVQTESTALFEQFTAMLGDSGLGIDGLEQRLIAEAVQRAQGNLSAAARSLKLTRAQLAYRLKRSAALANGGVA